MVALERRLAWYRRLDARVSAAVILIVTLSFSAILIATSQTVRTRSLERAAILEQASRKAAHVETLLHAFLRPPVYQTAYGRGCGTLYTAVYRPAQAAVELVWPGARWRQDCRGFADGTRTVGFDVTINTLDDDAGLPLTRAVADVERDAGDSSLHGKRPAMH